MCLFIQKEEEEEKKEKETEEEEQTKEEEAKGRKKEGKEEENKEGERGRKKVEEEEEEDKRMMKEKKRWSKVKKERRRRRRHIYHRSVDRTWTTSSGSHSYLQKSVLLQFSGDIIYTDHQLKWWWIVIQNRQKEACVEGKLSEVNENVKAKIYTT